jgi:hypothetical protein
LLNRIRIAKFFYNLFLNFFSLILGKLNKPHKMQSVENLDISRSFTSSPISSEHSFPLSINTHENSVAVEPQCTPIKKDTPPSESSDNSGLLTYSTPVVFPFDSHKTPLSIFQSRLSSTARKPRVNFHSIDDIVNGGKSKLKPILILTKINFKAKIN